MDHEPMTLEDARALAQTAHRGQEDKLGVDYIHHVEAVAAGLLDFDLEIQIAGMLHDVLEDSHFTLDDLRARGVPERSLAAIEMVSRNLHPDLSYDEAILQISTSLDATLVKISDNAHSSRPDRVAALELVTGKPTHRRYARARDVLYAAAPAGTACDLRLSEAVTDRSGRADVVLVVGQYALLSCKTSDLIVRGARIHQPKLRLKPSWVLVSPVEAELRCDLLDPEPVEAEVVLSDDRKQIDKVRKQVRDRMLADEPFQVGRLGLGVVVDQ